MHHDVAKALAQGMRPDRRPDRRSVLTGALGLGAVIAQGSVAGAARATDNLARPTSPFAWNDPAENLRILSRMWGTIEPGKQAILYVFGPMFGLTGATDIRPLFRMESIAVVRTYPQPGGAYRYLASQFILFTDFDTGDVLDSWANPLSRRAEGRGLSVSRRPAGLCARPEQAAAAL